MVGVAPPVRGSFTRSNFPPGMQQLYWRLEGGRNMPVGGKLPVCWSRRKTKSEAIAIRRMCGVRIVTTMF